MRIKREPAADFVAAKNLSVELSERQDSAFAADYLLCFYGLGIWVDRLRPGVGGLHPIDLDLRHVPVRPALGAEGPASTLPGMRVPGCPSSPGRPSFADFPRLERHGNDVHGRPHLAPCAHPADKLVWRTEVALPRYFVEFPVCWV